MLARRLSALVLLVLTVSPYTAPFQACDMAEDRLAHHVAAAPADSPLLDGARMVSEAEVTRRRSTQSAPVPGMTPGAAATLLAGPTGSARAAARASVIASRGRFTVLRV